MENTALYGGARGERMQYTGRCGVALTKHIGEYFLFEDAVVGTLEEGSMGVNGDFINIASGM